MTLDANQRVTCTLTCNFVLIQKSHVRVNSMTTQSQLIKNFRRSYHLKHIEVLEKWQTQNFRANPMVNHGVSFVSLLQNYHSTVAFRCPSQLISKIGTKFLLKRLCHRTVSVSLFSSLGEKVIFATRIVLLPGLNIVLEPWFSLIPENLDLEESLPRRFFKFDI